MNKPIFVKLDDYRDILNVVDAIKAHVAKTRSTINSINDLKKKEDEIIKSWNLNLDDVTKRIDDISKTLFENR